MGDINNKQNGRQVSPKKRRHLPAAKDSTATPRHRRSMKLRPAVSGQSVDTMAVDADLPSAVVEDSLPSPMSEQCHDVVTRDALPEDGTGTNDDTGSSTTSEDDKIPNTVVMTTRNGRDVQGEVKQGVESAEEEVEDDEEGVEGDGGIKVTCGENLGRLYLSRLSVKERIQGRCILFAASWWTPNEFQKESGREAAKDWKRTIRHGGLCLKQLLTDEVFDFSVTPPVCRCTKCTDPQERASTNSDTEVESTGGVVFQQRRRMVNDGMSAAESEDAGSDDRRKGKKRKKRSSKEEVDSWKCSSGAPGKLTRKRKDTSPQTHGTGDLPTAEEGEELVRDANGADQLTTNPADPMDDDRVTADDKRTAKGTRTEPEGMSSCEKFTASEPTKPSAEKRSSKVSRDDGKNGRGHGRVHGKGKSHGGGEDGGHGKGRSHGRGQSSRCHGRGIDGHSDLLAEKRRQLHKRSSCLTQLDVVDKAKDGDESNPPIAQLQQPEDDPATAEDGQVLAVKTETNRTNSNDSGTESSASSFQVPLVSVEMQKITGQETCASYTNGCDVNDKRVLNETRSNLSHLKVKSELAAESNFSSEDSTERQLHNKDQSFAISCIAKEYRGSKAFSESMNSIKESSCHSALDICNAAALKCDKKIIDEETREESSSSPPIGFPHPSSGECHLGTTERRESASSEVQTSPFLRSDFKKEDSPGRSLFPEAKSSPMDIGGKVHPVEISSSSPDEADPKMKGTEAVPASSFEDLHRTTSESGASSSPAVSAPTNSSRNAHLVAVIAELKQKKKQRSLATGVQTKEVPNKASNCRADQSETVPCGSCATGGSTVHWTTSSTKSSLSSFPSTTIDSNFGPTAAGVAIRPSSTISSLYQIPAVPEARPISDCDQQQHLQSSLVSQWVKTHSGDSGTTPGASVEGKTPSKSQSKRKRSSHRVSHLPPAPAAKDGEGTAKTHRLEGGKYSGSGKGGNSSSGGIPLSLASGMYGLNPSHLASLPFPASPYSLYPPYLFMGFPLQPLLPSCHSADGKVSSFGVVSSLAAAASAAAASAVGEASADRPSTQQPPAQRKRRSQPSGQKSRRGFASGSPAATPGDLLNPMAAFDFLRSRVGPSYPGPGVEGQRSSPSVYFPWPKPDLAKGESLGAFSSGLLRTMAAADSKSPLGVRTPVAPTWSETLLNLRKENKTEPKSEFRSSEKKPTVDASHNSKGQRCHKRSRHSQDEQPPTSKADHSAEEKKFPVKNHLYDEVGALDLSLK